MDVSIQRYLHETVGHSDLDGLRVQLNEELRTACSEMHYTDFTQYKDVKTFSIRLFSETFHDQHFWLLCKMHFWGNDKIIQLLNMDRKKINLFSLDFLRVLYWHPSLNLEAKHSTSTQVKTEAMQYGYEGEEFLLGFLNEHSDLECYSKSGKIVLQSISCIGATPDYLKFHKSSYPKSTKNPYQLLQSAYGIVEVKTTLTPENFECLAENTCQSEKIETLMQAAVRSRYIFISNCRPDVFQTFKSGKRKGMLKVKWLTPELNTLLVKTIEETTTVTLYNFSDQSSISLRNDESDKKFYLNLLTSARGRQIIGQALCFLDHHRDMSYVDCSAIYLYLSRDENKTPQYFIRIDFHLPADVLHYIEIELNKVFYREYITTCLGASK